MWTVRVALQRPYSFVVLASLNRDIRRTGGVEHADSLRSAAAGRRRPNRSPSRFCVISGGMNPPGEGGDDE